MTGGRLSGRRILLVEDEAVIAMLLEDMLIALGCEVVGVAARLDEALCLIRSESFDAAVLDVNLGGSPAIRQPMLSWPSGCRSRSLPDTIG